MSTITTRKMQSDHKPALKDLVEYMVLVQALQTELIADHVTNKALIDELLVKVGYLTHRDQNRSTTGTSPVMAIDTNFDVKNTETIAYLAGGVPFTLADNTNVDTGTTHTIAASQWGGFVLNATGTATLTAIWHADDFSSEALLIAQLQAIAFTADLFRLGYVTVNAHASGFTSGTDALTTGSGGNVATATNYYQYNELVAVTATTSAPTLTAGDPASTHTWSDVKY